MNKQKNSVSIKSIAFLILIFVIAIYLAYFYFFNKFSHYHEDNRQWKYEKLINISNDILQKLHDINIKSFNKTFDVNGKKITVFIQEAMSPVRSKISALLLHGVSSSSDVWVETQTINLLAAMGLKVYAIDLPGWAKSRNSLLPKDKNVNSKLMRARFLQNLIRELDLGKPIIISPSMSGSYSIPYMMLPGPESCLERLFAYVPIAPVYTNEYTHADYHRCEVPTMIVYGTNDTNLGLESLGNLRNMVNNEIREMMYAGHACYIERPMEWNNLLYNFVRNLQYKLGELNN